MRLLCRENPWRAALCLAGTAGRDTVWLQPVSRLNVVRGLTRTLCNALLYLAASIACLATGLLT